MTNVPSALEVARSAAGHTYPTGSSLKSGHSARSTISISLQTLTYMLFMAALINFGNQGKAGFIPGGYNAGNSDHMVLSTLGIHWADPTKYAGDWFLASSPQPHWFFDLLTFWGASLNALDATYFLFWMFGLLCFGLATALLTRQWVPGHAWLMGVAVTFVMSLAPWNSVGTGNSLIAFAVPAVVGGHMVYLLLALLNTSRYRAAALFAPLIAIVHVQQGAVIGILLGATVISRYITAAKARDSRRVWAAGVASLVTTGLVVIFGLTLRPVASKLEDFVEICDVMIPYHCAAHLWSLPLVYSSIALIVLAASTVLYVPNGARMTWITTVGLTCLGLLTGLLMDHMRVPVLGALFQGTNVYRLGAVVFPFAIWGMFAALVQAKATWRGLLTAQTAFICTFLYLGQNGWQLEEPTSLRFILSLLLVTLGVLALRALPSVAGNGWIQRLGILAFAALFAFNAVAAEAITPRPLNATFISNSGLREWGKQVEAVVPPGEQILTAPQWIVKTPTSRGVIADCKNVPYGGKPWRDWQKRIADLGGIDQCRPPYTQTFSDFSAQRLNRLANSYSVSYAILDVTQERHFDDLEQLGWRVALKPTEAISLYVWTNK